ncbi:NUMOD4 domain-containing protein [Microbacterium sp. NPDC089696]|uniref:NUMOD4 domain-containing protein n=1 Tax=Microbacterium sp. NPDC089696 TaxID=3364199 RepID=UPI0038220D00
MPDEREEWRLIPGLDRYAVSNLGRVKRLTSSQGTKAGTILETPLSSGGYKRFNVYPGDGSVRTLSLHRAMAQAFIPNPGNLPVVRHLNDIHDDNRLENLAWGTHAQNSRDMVENGHHRGLAKTHCKHGHEFTPENTHVYRGRRTCRRCVIMRTKNYRQRKREKQDDR